MKIPLTPAMRQALATYRAARKKLGPPKRLAERALSGSIGQSAGQDRVPQIGPARRREEETSAPAVPATPHAEGEEDDPRLAATRI